MNKLELNETYYTAEGNPVQYLGTLAGVAYVRHGVLGREDDGEPQEFRCCPEEHHGPLFREPPVPIVDAKVKARLDELETVTKAVAEAKAQLAQAKAGMLDLSAEAKRHAAIRDLLDWLDGKITHVVWYSDYSPPTITPAAGIPMAEERGEKWRRAIGLFSVPNESPKKDYYTKEVSWRVNHYHDGSGSWSDFIPCRSEAEAISKAQELIDAQLAAWRVGEHSRSWLGSVAKQCPWATLPQDWLDHVASERLAALQNAKGVAAAGLAAATQELDDALDAADMRRKKD